MRLYIYQESHDGQMYWQPIQVEAAIGYYLLLLGANVVKAAPAN